MADDGDGFVGLCEVVESRRCNRRWPLDLKARIVAESFHPGVRVVDVARRQGVVAHQLSDWRRQAREGFLTLPLDVLPALSAVTREAAPSVAEAQVSFGIMTVELGSGVVVRVPGDVAVERAAALVHALQGKR